MAIEAPKNEQVSGGEKNGGRKRIEVLLSVREEQIWGAYRLRNESEEELFRERC